MKEETGFDSAVARPVFGLDFGLVLAESAIPMTGRCCT